MHHNDAFSDLSILSARESRDPQSRVQNVQRLVIHATLSVLVCK